MPFTLIFGKITLKASDDANQHGPQSFDEPWQAQAYAMSQVLIESGQITPGDWAQTLGAAIKARLATGAEDTSQTYFEAVTDALTTALKMDEQEMEATAQEWRLAYETTPHGKPVNLDRTS